MATHKGQEGTVKVGSGAGTIIGELKEWSFSVTADTAEDTCQADTWRTHVVTFKSWSGSAKVQFDPADTGQALLTIGAAVPITFYETGTGGAGSVTFAGTALVTEIANAHPMDDILSQDFTFQGSGELVQSAVTGA